jgi:hypothetical protein
MFGSLLGGLTNLLAQILDVPTDDDLSGLVAPDQTAHQTVITQAAGKPARPGAAGRWPGPFNSSGPG